MIHYLDIVSIFIAPNKTETPLIVDPYAVLSFAITMQRFEPVSGRSRQIAQVYCAIQLTEFAPIHLFNCQKTPAALAVMKPLCLSTTKRPYHLPIVLCRAFNVKR
jgi:hypothetical protein